MCGTGGAYCDAPSCLFQYGPACDANQSPPGTNTTSVPRPQLGTVPYGVSIIHCAVPGKVALTFDDGPYIWTNDLLDILKSNSVKATFFVVGNNGGKGQINDPSTGYPAVIKRMYAEGHQIGSHTWSHQDLSTLTHQQRMDQIVKNEIAITDILGFFPTYLRPPYESCNSDCLTDLGAMGYHVMNYDVDTLDWQENYPHSQQIFLSALQGGKPATNSFIELSHDIHNGTVHGFAQFMITNLKQLGYTTALVGECLNDPSINWYRNPVTGQAWNSSSSSSSTTSNTSPTSTRPYKIVSGSTVWTSSSPTAGSEGVGGFGSGDSTNTTSEADAARSSMIATSKMLATIPLYLMFCLQVLLGT
jgi:peptidoglycan/xylan/chitin deacetylase (PgdA/CDA1 family)